MSLKCKLGFHSYKNGRIKKTVWNGRWEIKECTRCGAESNWIHNPLYWKRYRHVIQSRKPLNNVRMGRKKR